jgi:WD40 repeat protein
VVTFGGLVALSARQEQITDGVLTADHSAGLAVSSNARLGVTTQADGIGFVIIWRIGAHPAVVSHFTGGAPVALAPTSPTLLATTPAAVTQWSLANPAKPVRTATIRGPGQAQGIAYAPGRAMVAIAYARAIALWDLASRAAPHRIAMITLAADLGGPKAAASSQNLIAFSPDGRTLAAATARNTVSVWDVSNPAVPRYLATVGRDTGPIGALAFSPARPQLAYVSDGAVTVIDLTDPARQAHAPVPGITGSAGHSYALTYSPDGTMLTAVAVGSYQLASCIWKVTGLAQPLPATCHTGHTHLDGGITFASGGTKLVGPNNHWASRGQNPLIVWPTLLG